MAYRSLVLGTGAGAEETQVQQTGSRRRWTRDGIAGLVLGIQSVPDGLATGVLAGLNPLAGLHAYLVGTATGALFTSSTFLAVQGTGAMAMVIADVPALTDDPATALATLSVLTGIAMLVAGLARLGSLLRFVSNAVMVGFINAVGVNIVLGQLANLTGYQAEGANRLIRTINTLLNPDELVLESVAIGVATIVTILVLERTRLGPLGIVIGVAGTSMLVAVLGWSQVSTLADLGIDIGTLPEVALPSARLAPALLVPAISLAFVGLVQGASISAHLPNPDGRPSDASRDFVGQGAANLASGVLGGMPVGGSASASALNAEAGAQTKWSLIIASGVMAATIVVFGDIIDAIAFPALAGLLMLIGFRTIAPANLVAVWRTGPVQAAVLAVTFVLTMIIPLQQAVLAGVGLSVLLYVVRQSNQVVIRRRVTTDGEVREVDPPVELPADDVVVLQPYGSLFFAAAPVFEASLPTVTERSRNSVVILRLRGRTDVGTTFIEVLNRYAGALVEVGSKLVIVSASDRIVEQFAVGGLLDRIAPEDVVFGDDRVGAALRRAEADAVAWVDANR
jgi:SulP family sulfate permease